MKKKGNAVFAMTWNGTKQYIALNVSEVEKYFPSDPKFNQMSSYRRQNWFNDDDNYERESIYDHR